MFLSVITPCLESVLNITMAKDQVEHSLRHLHFTQGKSIGGKAKYAEFLKFEFLLVAKIHTVIFRVSTFRVKVTTKSYVPLKLWKTPTKKCKTNV